MSVAVLKVPHVLRVPVFNDETLTRRVMKKLRRVFLDDEVTTTLEDTFLYMELRCVVTRLRLVGALPLQHSDTGEVTFHFWSLPMLYCVCAYSVSVPMLLLIMKGMVEGMRTTDKFYEIIFSQLFVALLIPYLLLPLTMWRDAELIAKFFNDMADFQRCYLAVTNKRLELNLKSQCVKFVWKTVIVCLISLPIWVCGQPYLQLYEIPTFYINRLLFKSAVSLIWRYSSFALSKAGESLVEKFKEDVSDNISAEKVGEYKLLWLKLTALTEQFGYCASRTFIIDAISSLWYITSSLYGSIACLKTGHYVMLGMFITAGLFSGMPFIVMCKDAHEVPRNVKHRLQQTLQTLLPTSLKPPVWKEMEAFLQVIASNTAEINLGGYVVVNRHLVQNAGAAVVTYLIVMLQFQLSLTDITPRITTT